MSLPSDAEVIGRSLADPENLVASGTAGLVMVWTNQKYWQ